MKCYDKPLRIRNPYPDEVSTVTDMIYENDLVLFRPRDRLFLQSDGSVTRPTDDIYLTGAPYRIGWSDAAGKWHCLTVPAGFVTDLTSVPWLLRSFISRAGPWLEASIVHDWLYIAWQDLADRTPRRQDRLFADRLMWRSMGVSGVGILRRMAIFLAVRMVGWWSFGKRRRMRYADATDARIRHLCETPGAGVVRPGGRTS